MNANTPTPTPTSTSKPNSSNSPVNQSTAAGEMMNQTISKPFIGAGIILILATGLIHFINAPASFQDIAYKGVLFVLNGVGAIVSAIGIYRGARTWGWMLGLSIALSALLGYIASRTIGMPGLPAEPDAWLEPMGMASMVAEGLFIIVAFGALRASVQSRKST